MHAKELQKQAHAYILANPVCIKHQANLLTRVSKFAVWAGDKPLDANTVNEFLVYLEGQGRSPHTVNGYRASIMAVWSFATGQRVPFKIRRVRPPQHPVEGWRVAEIRQLCRIARTFRGTLPNGVPKRLFWLTAIHCGFATGLRYGDLTRLKRSQIRRDRVCVVVQSKTGKPVTVRFSKAAMRLIARHGRDVVLPIPHTQKWFCHQFSSLVERAGIRGGSFRWLRRSAGSYVELATGRGPELLGNTRAVFDSNYKVSDIVKRDPPEPPPISRAG